MSENTPLLAADATEPTIQPNTSEPLLQASQQDSATTLNDDDTPLPRTQIFLLCYARVVEPIAYFSIFPFINKMIQETGNLEEADVGFYSGLIVSHAALTSK